MKKISLYIFIIILLPYYAISQEVLVGVSENLQIKKHLQAKDNKANREMVFVKLPFFDDFSDSYINPKPSLWSDDFAFINNDYAYQPISVGVATLDAIDNKGNVYEDASSYPFKADKLTSQYIRLDSIFYPNEAALTAADSIYLSFYYQPKGYGNMPESGDSLVLEFLNSNLLDTVFIEEDLTVDPPIEADTIIIERWNRVWSTSVSDSLENISFKQVMIPITDEEQYFNKMFKFRFVNYASIPNNSFISWQSNVDQWNIDYIRLDYDRNYADTIPRDMTFVDKAPNFLKRYTAMPYWQYSNNFIDEMNTKFPILVANMDDSPHNTSYQYNIYNAEGELVKNYDGGSITIRPFYTHGYASDPFFTNPPVSTPFPFSSAPTHFTVEHIITSDEVLNCKQNDTIIGEQIFDNYYAYDDGSAEAGYGLTPNGSMLAYRFQLSARDTLTAIQFHFNKTLKAGNEQYFYIMVWDDNNGEPGNVIYRSEKGVLPKFGDDINEFSTYEIDPVAFSAVNSVFYVGWQQTSPEILNVGFDFANNNQENILYNTGLGWNTSVYEGSLMIRPVFGKPNASQEPQVTPKKSVSLYPNPVNKNAQIQINLPDGTPLDPLPMVEVYSITGKLMYRDTFNQHLDAGRFSKGIYILKIKVPATGKEFANKFVISN